MKLKLVVFLIFIICGNLVAQLSIGGMYARSFTSIEARTPNSVWYYIDGGNLKVSNYHFGMDLGWRYNERINARVSILTSARDTLVSTDIGSNPLLFTALTLNRLSVRVDNVKKSGFYFGGGLSYKRVSDYEFFHYRPYELKSGIKHIHEVGVLGVMGISFYNFYFELNIEKGMFHFYSKNYDFSYSPDKLKLITNINLVAGYRFNIKIPKSGGAVCPTF